MSDFLLKNQQAKLQKSKGFETERLIFSFLYPSGGVSLAKSSYFSLFWPH